MKPLVVSLFALLASEIFILASSLFKGQAEIIFKQARGKLGVSNVPIFSDPIVKSTTLCSFHI
jgi:hypothetical protein